MGHPDFDPNPAPIWTCPRRTPRTGLLVRETCFGLGVHSHETDWRRGEGFDGFLSSRGFLRGRVQKTGKESRKALLFGTALDPTGPPRHCWGLPSPHPVSSRSISQWEL